MVNPATLTQILDASPAEDFFGRSAELDAITRLARDAVRGVSRMLALAGPAGSGKSTLLRRSAVVLAERGAEVTPLLVDLTELPAAGGGEAVWRALFQGVLRQALAIINHVEPTHQVWLSGEPAQLSGLCYGAGLGELAPLCRPGLALTVETWRTLLRMLAARGLSRPLVFIDGAAEGRPGDVERLTLILEGCRAESCAALFEAPGCGDWAPGRAPELVDRIELPPLTAGEAVALAQAVGRRRLWALPESALRPIATRLGPWPGWVRAWAMMIQALPPRGNPVRSAEEGYVDWLTRSPWARGMRRAFERVAAPAWRERALRLIEAAAACGHALALDEAAALTGLEPAEVEGLLNGLADLGLLERRGVRWSGPRWPALADWLRLSLAASGGPHGLEAARLELLTRRLTEPRPALDEPAAETGTGELAPKLLGQFRGQILPQVLFQFGDYYEALGRLTPSRRREMVIQSSSTLAVPEVVGVVPWEEGAGLTAGVPPISYARAYREGRYQRSHEEIWIVLDWSEVRALTTPEIAKGLEIAQRLESRLGAGRIVRWLILGETASPEALEYIRRERLLCSNREQLLMMRELLAPAPAPGGALRGVAQVGEETAEADPPRPRAVIEISEMGEPPHPETSRLTLPARPDSELIAAMMAEKIAIRGGFAAAAVGQIKTAVLEGALNAIEHSPNTEKPIEFAFDLTREALVITIENEGPPFDPLAVPVPYPPAKLTAARKRGWGITLMQRFMDEVGYEPCRRGTRLRLVKRRAALAPAREMDAGALRGKA